MKGFISQQGGGVQTALLCQDDTVPPLSSLSSYLMNLLLPLSKSGVVWALAVLEKHVRRDFFIYKPSAWQMLRAGTFQARNHAATGTLPPSLGAGTEGWAGIIHLLLPCWARPIHSNTSLLISSPAAFPEVGKFAEEASCLRIPEFGYIKC